MQQSVFTTVSVVFKKGVYMTVINGDISNSEVIQPKKKKHKRNYKNQFIASVAGQGISTAGTVLAIPALKTLRNYSKNLTSDQVKLVNNQIDNVLNNITNLSQKGVEFQDMKGFEFILKKVSKISKKLNPTANIIEGKNALFSPILNTIQINREKLPLAAFHEMGHAFNWHNSKFWKSMQILNIGCSKLAPMLMLLPALTKKEVAADGQELTKKQKIKNGVRNASPFVAAAMMIPTLMEEGMASIRGCKWAKEVLDPAMYKKVLKTNTAGFASYAITALSMALATFATKKVKDHLDEKKAQKASMAA